MAEETQQKAYLFDDYFIDEDSLETVTIRMKGKDVPIRIVPALTIKERQAAQEQAVDVTFDKEGNVQVGKVDMTAFTVGIAFQAIKEWPFRFRNGEAVPITLETVGKLPPPVLDELAARVLGKEESDNKAANPFVKASSEPS